MVTQQKQHLIYVSSCHQVPTIKPPLSVTRTPYSSYDQAPATLSTHNLALLRLPYLLQPCWPTSGPLY